MDYLVLSRREGEAILLGITPDADPAIVLEQLKIGIKIDVAYIKGNQTNFSIEAPAIPVVLRDFRFVGTKSEKW